MNERTKRRGDAALIAAGLLLGLAGEQAQAQATAPAAETSAGAPEPSPYYLGASQGFTHDTNVYRIPGGTGDNYSSTSLLAGFDQRISRQRVFGTANVSLNRYQDQTRLNNTSYDLATGLAWETLYNLSGNLNATLSQQLSAPTANVASPLASRNLLRRQGIDAVGRWGGVSILTLEGTLGYSTLDYSAPEYVTAESKQESGSLGLYYRQSPLLRLGVALRLDRTRTPKAFQQPDGSYLSNQVNGRNLDFLADYELSDRLDAHGRLSYTRQTNSSAGSDADFSGITGDLRLAYRPTAKLGFSLTAARQAGFDTNRSAPVYLPDPTLVTTPIAALYENNRVTTSFGLGATYAATSKINATAGLSYTRARVVSTLSTGAGTVGSPDVVDKSQGATLGLAYAIARPWLLGCNLGYDKREVSGAVSYSYSAKSVGCSGRFTWR